MITKVLRSGRSVFLRSKLTFSSGPRSASLAPTDVLVSFQSRSCPGTSDPMRLKQLKCSNLLK